MFSSVRDHDDTPLRDPGRGAASGVSRGSWTPAGRGAGRLTLAATAVLAVLLPVLLLAGCGGDARGDALLGDGDGLQLVASFYPLQFVTQRVAGDAGVVRALTKPGVEPHDVELTPRQLGSMADADLVVHLAGFQPAVDDALQAVGTDAGFDVSGPARLETHPGRPDGAGQANEQSGAVLDPHFWLDPTRLADVADALADRLSTLAPERAAAFTANAAALRDDLADLDAQFSTGLRDCPRRELVTGHAAFGYLAARYGLEQVGVTGLDPEAEPSPRDLAEVAAFVQQHDVSTVYAETLVSPAVARTVAGETGARTAVLDPVEGITEASAGRDYLEVMRANLATLRDGQGCR